MNKEIPRIFTQKNSKNSLQSLLEKEIESNKYNNGKMWIVSAFADTYATEFIANITGDHKIKLISYIGINNGITSFDAISNLTDFENNTREAHYYCNNFKNKTNFLHSKIYYLEHLNNSILIVGSNNLTRNGLNKNIETYMVWKKADFELRNHLEGLKFTYLKCDTQLKKINKEYFKRNSKKSTGMVTTEDDYNIEQNWKSSYFWISPKGTIKSNYAVIGLNWNTCKLWYKNSKPEDIEKQNMLDSKFNNDHKGNISFFYKDRPIKKGEEEEYESRLYYNNKYINGKIRYRRNSEKQSTPTWRLYFYFGLNNENINDIFAKNIFLFHRKKNSKFDIFCLQNSNKLRSALRDNSKYYAPYSKKKSGDIYSFYGIIKNKTTFDKIINNNVK